MKYFNITEEEISKRMFNIFIGVSLGNKLLTPALVKRYVKWAHDNTHDDVLVLVADEIDVINWMVFRKLSKEEAEKKVEDKAYQIFGMFEKAKRELYREYNDPTFITKIHCVFWEDIKNEGYNDLKAILEKEYHENLEFKKAVLYFVNKYIEIRQIDIVSDDKDRLAEYIISELPTLIGGLLWNGKLYNLILYPTYVDSGMSGFVLDIRAGKYFESSKLKLRQICNLVEDFLPEDDKQKFLSEINDLN